MNEIDYKKLWDELAKTLQEEYRSNMRDVSDSALSGETFEVIESLLSATNCTHVLNLMGCLKEKERKSNDQ